MGLEKSHVDTRAFDTQAFPQEHRSHYTCSCAAALLLALPQRHLGVLHALARKELRGRLAQEAQVALQRDAQRRGQRSQQRLEREGAFQKVTVALEGGRDRWRHAQQAIGGLGRRVFQVAALLELLDELGRLRVGVTRAYGSSGVDMHMPIFGHG